VSHAESRPAPAPRRALPEAANDTRLAPRLPTAAPAQVLPFPRPQPSWPVSHYVSLDGAALPVFTRLR